MTAFRARALLLAFLLIFAGVAFNAMALQESDGPWRSVALLKPDNGHGAEKQNAPARQVRKVLPPWDASQYNLPDAQAATSKSVANPNQTSGSTTVRVTPPGNSSSETVRAIQRELIVRGYEPGPVDGILGLMTRAAIMAYQYDQNLALTAEPSDLLLEQILLGVTGQMRKGRKVSPGPQARVLARGVQEALTGLGYSTGPADGVVSTNTSRAIKAFERDHGLAPTGRVSGRLIATISRATGTRFKIAAAW